MKEFWEEIIPEEPIWNWHIPYICHELQSIAMRVFLRQDKLYDLIINVSPGSTKSTICSVMFPAWVWTVDASMRTINCSYSHHLSLDLADKGRQIVMSEKYERLFPDARLRVDAKGKEHFKNESNGDRVATSVGGSILGKHAHIILVDDPLNPDDAEAVSQLNLKRTNSWIESTLFTRCVKKSMTPIILIMQRLHEEDPTGYLLEKKKNIKHICLPAELTNDIKPEELKDRYVDSLFDPVRLPRKVLVTLEEDELGARKYAGQYLQRPAPKGGAMFDMDKMRKHVVRKIPSPVVARIRYWDKAGTQDAGCFTVGCLMGKCKDGSYIVLDVVRFQKEARHREPIIRSVAEGDGPLVKIYLEQEPGSGGKESVENSIRNLAGFSAYADRPTGSKDVRAEPLSVQVEAGNVFVLERAWTKDYLREFENFPNSKYRDQVDASSGAFNKLAIPNNVGVW